MKSRRTNKRSPDQKQAMHDLVVEIMHLCDAMAQGRLSTRSMPANFRANTAASSKPSTARWMQQSDHFM